MKTPTNSKNHYSYSNPLAAYRKLPVTLTMISYRKPSIGHIHLRRFFLHPMRGDTAENRPVTNIIIRLPEQFKDLVRCLKVVDNEKIGGSGMCQSVPICLGPRRSRFVSLSILLLSLILMYFRFCQVNQN